MKPRRQTIRRHVIGFVAMVAVATAFMLWLLVESGGLSSPTGTHYSVSAVLPSAGAQLVGGARVTMAGIQVGTIDSVARRGRGAVVRMTLTDGRVTPIATDSRAQLRSRTPLGENYISIIAGRAHTTLPSGSTLPLTQADDSVDVDQALSVLQGSARTRARQLIQGIGGAVAGRGERLNTLLGATAGTIDSGARVVDVLDGQRAQISQLVQQLGDVAAGLGERGTDIENLARGGLASFRTIAAQDNQLRSLLRVLPSALTQVRTTTGKLSTVTAEASPVLFNLAATLREARPAAIDLRPAANELHGVVSDLGAAAPPLETTLRRLRSFSAPTADALPDLHKTLCQVNPMVAYAKPYTQDIISMLTSLGSSSNAYDAIGHTIRLAATVNDASLVGLPPALSNAAHTLLNSGLLGKANGMTYSPYPAPGQENATAHAPYVNGPDAVRATSGYVYPHVKADC
jgi:phospholipid/cholesterol/gamma-HCH transport system substrate-binding protein